MLNVLTRARYWTVRAPREFKKYPFNRTCFVKISIFVCLFFSDGGGAYRSGFVAVGGGGGGMAYGNFGKFGGRRYGKYTLGLNTGPEKTYLFEKKF